MRHKKQGLTLLEVLIALAIFAIVMIAVSSTIVSGLQLRRSSQLDAEAQNYAASVLERYKDFWSSLNNYKTQPTIPPEPLTPPLPAQPAAFPFMAINYACIDTDGTVLVCDSSDPPLRRVSVTLTDLNGKVRAQLATEIGRPPK